MTSTAQICAGPTCEKTAPNGYLCTKCAAQLDRDFATIADLSIESGVTLTRTDRIGTGGGKSKGGPAPLPVNHLAVLVRDEVRSSVSTWLRHLAGDRIPDDVRTVEQACRWMLTYSSAWLLLPEVGDFAQAMAMCAVRLRRLVDRAADRVVVGECDLCGQNLVAEPNALTAVCEPCEQVVDVSTARKVKITQAHLKPLTKDEAINAVAALHRMRITERTINRWIARGEVKPDADGLIPAGEVLFMAAKRRASHARTA